MEDKVCLDRSDSDLCVPQFKFFAITKQEGLAQADGILGLSPVSVENGPSMVQALKQAGAIDSMQVSFFLSHKRPSTITFGQYNDSLVKEGDEESGYGIHWYELTGKHYWQVKI